VPPDETTSTPPPNSLAPGIKPGGHGLATAATDQRGNRATARLHRFVAAGEDDGPDAKPKSFSVPAESTVPRAMPFSATVSTPPLFTRDAEATPALEIRSVPLVEIVALVATPSTSSSPPLKIVVPVSTPP